MARKSKEDLKVLESAVGALLAIVAALVALLCERGVTLEQVYRLARPEGAKLLEKIADAVAKVLEPVELAQKIGLIEEVTDIPAPEGGKVFRVLASVDWAAAWGEYILSCCPQTGRNWQIFKTAEQYLTKRKGRSLESTCLVWFGRGVRKTTAQVAEWLNSAKLEWTWAHPRISLSIIGRVSNIVAQLEALGYCYDSVGIVTGHECKLDGNPRVPYAWRRSDGGREADLGHVSDEWGDSDLFAFFCK